MIRRVLASMLLVSTAATAAAMSGIEHIMDALPACCSDGNNLEARSEMLLGAHLAGVALAANNGGTLVVRETTQVNGKALPAGEYKVRWEGAGPSVQVTILSGKKEVMTTSGAVKEASKVEQRDWVLYRGENGKREQIAEIHFGGTKTFLVFESATSTN